MADELADRAWTKRAACRGAVGLFLGHVNETAIEVRRRHAACKEVCRTCPVRDECLDWAMTQGYWQPGSEVWGGLDDEERRRLARVRRLLT